MKKFLKIFGIILALLLASMIILPMVFKGKIVEIVKTEINNSVNAKVDFEDFSLSLFRSFPDFSFGIEGLSVVGNQPFENDTLTYIKKIYLTLDLSSVFSGETYEIKSILIDEPVVNVKILRDGKANYDIAIEDSTAIEGEESTESSAFSMKMKKFKVENAKIIYDDKEGDMKAILNDFDMVMSGDFTESITDLDINAQIADFSYIMDGVNYMKHGKIDFDALIGADLDKFAFTFKDNKLKINNLVLAFEGSVAMPEDDIDMDLVFSAPAADFKTLLSLVPAVYLTDMEGLKASGKAAFSGFAKGIYNDELMPAFGIKMQVEDGKFQYPDLPQSVDNVSIMADINSPSSDLDKMTIDVSKFHFSVAQNPMDISLKLKTPMSDPDIDAKFKGKFNLADVEKFYPLDEGMKLSGLFDMDVSLKGKQSSIDNGYYSKFESSGFVNLTDMNYSDNDMPDGVSIAKASMDFSPKHISLSKFEATYKKNSVSANGLLMNYIDYAFGDGVLVGNLNLKSEYLNIDEVMGQEEPVAAEETTTDTSAMEVFLVPENIDFTMKTVIGRIKYDNININSLYGSVRIAESRVNLEDLNMEMLDGKLNLNGFYSTIMPDTPNVSMVMEIRDFNIKKAYDAFNTIQIFAPLSKYIQGSFSSLLTFNANIDGEMNPIYKTIDSKGLLKTSALSIKGSPMFSKLATELKYDKLNNLNAKPVMIDFAISNGNLVVQPFEAEIDNIPVKIDGTANIDRTINYKMDMEIPSNKLGTSATSMINNLQAQATTAGLSLGNTESIPVRAFITGPANNPNVKVAISNPAQDVQDQLEDMVKEEINKVKDEAKEELDKLKNEALDEAEKRKQQVQDSLNSIVDAQKAELEKKKREAEAAAKKKEEEAKKKLEEEAKKKLKKFF